MWIHRSNWLVDRQCCRDTDSVFGHNAKLVLVTLDELWNVCCGSSNEAAHLCPGSTGNIALFDYVVPVKQMFAEGDCQCLVNLLRLNKVLLDFGLWTYVISDPPSSFGFCQVSVQPSFATSDTASGPCGGPGLSITVISAGIRLLEVPVALYFTSMTEVINLEL